MSETRQKFATQLHSHLLEDLRSLARREGRQIQTLVEEAIAALLEARRLEQPRPHVMAAYRRSLVRYSELYKKLAE